MLEVMKMNRKVALLLVFCIILSIFALTACSNDAESHPDKAKENKPTVSDNPLLPKPSEDPEPTTVLGETEDAGSEYIDKLVFIGDSTTYGLKAYGMLSGGKDTLQVWTPSSGTLALFNQSWATIVYPETGEEIPITEAVERRQPEYLVLTIGVNGVSMMDEEQFKADYTDLVQRIQKVSPDTKIICNSIYPVQASYEAKDNGINNTVIERANGWIKQIAEETGTRYLDSASVLKGEDGCLNPDYGNGDGIHLGPAGFERVLNYIRTHAYK